MKQIRANYIPPKCNVETKANLKQRIQDAKLSGDPKQLHQAIKTLMD